jgi:hypothetical protein
MLATRAPSASRYSGWAAHTSSVVAGSQLRAGSATAPSGTYDTVSSPSRSDRIPAGRRRRSSIAEVVMDGSINIEL